MFILKRYLLNWILTSIGLILTSIFIMWNFDGIGVKLTVITSILWILLFIPVSIYLDYLTIKKYIISIYDVKKGKKDPKELVQESIPFISERTSIPEFVIEYIVNKFKLTEKIK